ncbi:MAG: thioesterase family protein [Oscillospiraceae bacterium]|nr:thioesterase family protein [Oscillospiraceae bacterium]
MEIPVGTKGREEVTVVFENTAGAVGSGLLEVFATPMMIGLMESAAAASLSPYLEEGKTTVGTKLDVAHTAATPIGMKVWAETEVTAVNGKEIIFSVSAYDEKGQVGHGIHHRFIVDSERFMQKAQAKLG